MPRSFALWFGPSRGIEPPDQPPDTPDDGPENYWLGCDGCCQYCETARHRAEHDNLILCDLCSIPTKEDDQ